MYDLESCYLKHPVNYSNLRPMTGLQHEGLIAIVALGGIDPFSKCETPQSS